MLHIRVNDLLLNNKFDEAFNLIENFEDIDDIEKIISKAKVLERMGEYEQSLQILDKAKELCELNNALDYKEIVNMLIAGIYSYTQNKNKAIIYISSIEIELFKNLKYAEYWEAMTYFTTATIFYYYGSIEMALSNYNSAFRLFQKYNDKYYIIACLNNIGDIYKSRGEYSEAKNQLFKALELMDNVKTSILKGVILTSLGEITSSQDNFDEASTYLLKSLNMKIQGAPLQSIAYTLFQLLLVSIELSDENKISEVMTFIKEIKEKNPNTESILSINTLAHAIYHKNKRRIIDIANAEKLFMEIIENEHVTTLYRIFALLNMCELLIMELKIYENKDILIDINNFLSKLQTISEEQNLIQLRSEILLLQSQIFFIHGDTNQSISLMNEAMDMTKQYNNIKLYNKIEQEKKRLFDEIYSMKNKLEGSISEKVKQTKIAEYLQSIIKNKDMYL